MENLGTGKELIQISIKSDVFKSEYKELELFRDQMPPIINPSTGNRF